MSQMGYFGELDAQTITGNVGGAVSPDLGGNFDFTGTGLITITGTPATNSLEVAIDGAVVSSYVTDDGTATPALNVLNVVGGANITTSSNPPSDILTLRVSGTTEFAVQVGNATGSLTSLAVGTNGQVLLGSTGANAIFGTLGSSDNTVEYTLGAGTLTLQCRDATEIADGVVELATDLESIDGTDTVRAIVPTSLKAKLGVQTSHGLPYGAGTTGAVAWTAEPTHGQFLIGDTGNIPQLATITGGAGIVVTNAAHSITLDAVGGGLPWNEVVGIAQACAINNGYILNNAALVTATLPAVAAFGSIVRIAGKGAGGFIIAQNAGQVIHFCGSDTTIGVGGSLASTVRYDAVELVCIVADTEFLVISSIGNLTIV